ncbi:hypothetical protein A4S06_08675 [Erysipelotrichaceae bacterium MTC7]|nr:hypothetical protein A4S06_08675 [Erysipelotrichaceae bacterium MTC7]
MSDKYIKILFGVLIMIVPYLLTGTGGINTFLGSGYVINLLLRWASLVIGLLIVMHAFIKHED